MTDQDKDNLNIAWEELLNQLERLIGKRPADLNAVLFLVGVQELGKGPKRFSKEQKQDLLHIGVCQVLSLPGYYKQSYVDKDGWPHFTILKPVPHADLFTQEDFLKNHVIQYFSTQLS